MIHPYATPTYAAALSYWGAPLFVPDWNCSVIVRDIMPGFKDASGVYPLAILPKEADLNGGLHFLQQKGLVSVVLVLDEDHRPPLEQLKRHFSATRIFKTHYLYRPSMGPLSFDSATRYKLRQTLKSIRIEAFNLRLYLNEWFALYDGLVKKRGLSDVHAFPLSYFKALANLDGVTALGAWKEDSLVSCHLWIGHDRYQHSHLAATNAEGYKNRAAFALNEMALHYFSDSDVLNFGGGSGYANDETNSLACFKRDFSNDTSMSYICGAILDQERYSELIKENGQGDTNFFPAYRAVPKIITT